MSPICLPTLSRLSLACIDPQRMCYHFGKGWWKSYTGEKKYKHDTYWAAKDT